MSDQIGCTKDIYMSGANKVALNCQSIYRVQIHV